MKTARKYERDIDLLLAEEFSVNATFVSWFLSFTKFQGADAVVVDVVVSWAEATGESDLVVIFERRDTSARFALLIEDKIDAPFQPDQRLRYQGRGEIGVRKGLFADYQVVLCAPMHYYEVQAKAHEFECFVSYERIAEFLRASDKSVRGNYRADFIQTAASKRANTWERIIDEATETLWSAAYDLASREFPILEMKRLKVTEGSTWIKFRPSDFPTKPSRVYVYLKGSHGHVDLTFSNTLAFRFHELVENLLPEDMRVSPTQKSTAIRLTTEPFQISDGFDVTLGKIRKCFVHSERLIKFYRANRPLLDAAAKSSARE